MGLLLCGCCFTGFSAKTNEIILIIANVIASALLGLSLDIIKWNRISKINLIAFSLMYLIVITTFIFIVLLRCWRSSGQIKTTKKDNAIKIVTAAFVLNIINLFICVFEEIAIVVSLRKISPKCDDFEDDLSYFLRILNLNVFSDLNECQREKKKFDKQYSISYLTLSYLEIMIILSICILNILKRRIINKTDYDVQNYGRQVVVVQPAQVVAIPNNYYYAQNLNFGQRYSNPYYANQYIDARQVNVIPQQHQVNGVGQSMKNSNKSYSSSSRYIE